MDTSTEARLATALYDTPWGAGFVRVHSGLLWDVALPGVAPGAVPTSEWSEISKADGVAAARWASQLTDYFAGRRSGWVAVELEPELEGLDFTEFTRGVYRALLGIGAGETVGYGELAELAGYPRAARAVGSAMARNPLPVVIPCHRVIRADGSLGRYGSDPLWKLRLLGLERASAQRVVLCADLGR